MTSLSTPLGGLPVIDKPLFSYKNRTTWIFFFFFAFYYRNTTLKCLARKEIMLKNGKYA